MKKIKKLMKNELLVIIIGAVSLGIAFLLDKLLSLTPLTIAAYIVALIISGHQVFTDAVRGILRRDLLDEKFLMSVAAIGAMCIGEYAESVAVMVFYLVGEYFQHIAVRKSRDSIKGLMDIQPDEATVIENGCERVADAGDVAVGTKIVIRPGERVPIDCEVISGNADVDTSALTGESMPRAASVGSMLDSGTIVLNGVLYCKTVKAADESAAARVLNLVENANERKSKEENFITSFAHIYTPVVVGAAVVLAILPPLLGITPWHDAIIRALTFLVVSCPCALVISVPLAFFGGIGCAASSGILYKGGNTFAPIARADVFAFDKTGTLTTGELKISALHPVGMSKERLVSLAASAEYGSNHPIAMAIKRGDSSAAPAEELTEVAGKGIVATVAGNRVAVGNAALMEDTCKDSFTKSTVSSGVVYVSVDGRYAGYIEFSDTVKPEAKESLAALRSLGAKKCIMLSGDRRESAERVGGTLGLDEVYAELLPEDKFSKLEEIITSADKHTTVYVGDGINDAPSLARADVGVAMGSIGSDSAIEAADIVIVSDDLAKLPTAVSIARHTLRIAKENIVFALAVKLLMLVLIGTGAVGGAVMWLGVFSDVGVCVLAILNSMRALRYRGRHNTATAVKKI